MIKAPIRSVAGHVLATGVLGEDTPMATEKSREDLTRILAKIDGVEGQTERANAIRKQLELM